MQDETNNRQKLATEIDVLSRAVHVPQLNVEGKIYYLRLRGVKNLEMIQKFHDQFSSAIARADIQKVVESYRSMVTTTDPNFHDHMLWIESILRSLYNTSKDEIDLYPAISIHEQMHSLLPTDRQQRFEWLSRSEYLLRERLKRHFSVAFLEEWINVAEDLLQYMPIDSSDYPTLLGNLATRYRQGYETLSNRTYLSKAIHWGREAVNVFEQNQNSKEQFGMVRYQLAMILHAQFDHTRDNLELLDEARVLLEHSIKHCEDTFTKAGLLDSLGNNLRLKYRSTGNIDLLNESIARTEDAITLAGEDSGFLHNLGLSLSLRHKRRASRQDLTALDRAIEVTQKSLLGDLFDHERGSKLFNLGSFASSRFELTQADKDEKLAISSSRQGASLADAQPLQRIQMAHRAARHLTRLNRWSEAWDCIRQAVELIPVLAPRYFARKEQQHLLEKLSGLSSEACSIALSAGLPPYEAIRILELGRGVILSYFNDINTDISCLKMEHKDIYEEYEKAKETLNGPLVRNMEETDAGDFFGISGGSIQDLRRAAFHSLEQTIDRIRSLPNYVSFLLPPSEAELMNLAQGGYIVLLNESEFRRDAIVITPKSILPPLSLTFPWNWTAKWLSENTYRQLFRGSSKKFEYRNSVMRGYLLKLWDSIVGPICDYLRLHRGEPSNIFERPRIWWIGTGHFSRLPLHAAGDLCFRAISSYVSTIKLLRQIREKSRAVRLEHPSGLLATVPKIPGKKDLLFACKEKENVFQFKDSIDWKYLPSPNAAQLINSLPHCQIVHLICHGVSDERDPSQSHLLLRGSNVSPEILTVETISKAVAGRGTLAYLSACSTVNNSSMGLLDECLQIGTAFQLAGFPHVIGTMWPAYDHICPEFARNFYKYLALLIKDKELNDFTYAVSFHMAMLLVRKMNRETPLLWAPFVHLGP